MAADIFKITGLNGSSDFTSGLWYKSDGKFYSASGNSYAGSSIGITIGNTLNPVALAPSRLAHQLLI